MQNLLLIGLSRQVALAREMDVIANNVANINTTGYKADGSLFEEYLSKAQGGSANSRLSFVLDRATFTDMRHGPVERTGNPLDLAINGDGFFAVQTAAGIRYTRNGSFQVNAAGQIVTADGDIVMGDSGPITLQPNDRQVSIRPDGTVSVREGNSKADTQRGKLRLVTFDSTNNLQKVGGGLFNYVGNAPPRDDTQSSVLQGALEKSNVHSVVEMSRMIEVSRSYMQIASMLQQQSDMSQTSIDKLADVPS